MTDKLMSWTKVRIEELEAQLAAMTAERDKYESVWLEAEGKLSDVEAERDHRTTDMQTYRAAIPRAYQMGWRLRRSVSVTLRSQRVTKQSTS